MSDAKALADAIERVSGKITDLEGEHDVMAGKPIVDAEWSLDINVIDLRLILSLAKQAADAKADRLLAVQPTQDLIDWLNGKAQYEFDEIEPHLQQTQYAQIAALLESTAFRHSLIGRTLARATAAEAARDAAVQRVEELEAALRPFAQFAEHIPSGFASATCLWNSSWSHRAIANVAEFRRAAAALAHPIENGGAS